MKTNMKNKGQMRLADGPQLVMIVGFIFIMMATIAYVSEQYRDGMTANNAATVTNETSAFINDTTYTVGRATDCNFEDFSVTAASNNTDGVLVNSGNYTISASLGTIVGSTGRSANWSDVNLTYTFNYAGSSCNITQELESELLANTSIAGIVLTISLIGIVLTILVGIFIASRRGRL